MSDVRYFKNEFPPFCEDAAMKLVDIKNKKLTDNFIKEIKKSITSQLLSLDSGISSDIDWGDTSVYTGVSGYTLLYLHLGAVLDDENYTKKAVPLVEISLKKLKGRRISFLCGDAGPYALAAVIYTKIGKTPEVSDCLNRLKNLKNDVLNAESSLPDELLYGRVGYLYSLLFVQKKIGKDVIGDQLVHSVIDSILSSGLNLAQKEGHKSPLMYKWHDKYYLGAAHGLCGILFILLQVKERLTLHQLEEIIQPAINYFCSLVLPSGNFPSSLGNTNDRLVHWCHGAPGAVFLLGKAFQVYGEEKYLQMARKCGEIIWNTGLLKKGYGLCHGAAGNGYALLYLYQVTGDNEYLYKTAQFAKWCQAYGTHGCRTPDRPMSLFEGLAGNIHFLSDLINLNEANFPAFCI